MQVKVRSESKVTNKVVLTIDIIIITTIVAASSKRGADPEAKRKAKDIIERKRGVEMRRMVKEN